MRGSIIKQVTKRDENGKAIKWSDNWTIILNLGKDETGKRKQKWFTFKGTKHGAEKKLRELLIDNDHGVLVKPSKLSVSQWLDQWLADYRSRIAQNTAQTYQFFIERHIKPAIGKLPVTSLTPAHLNFIRKSWYPGVRMAKVGCLAARLDTFTLHCIVHSKAPLGSVSFHGMLLIMWTSRESNTTKCRQ